MMFGLFGRNNPQQSVLPEAPVPFFDDEQAASAKPCIPPEINLNIAYQAPRRPVRRVLLQSSGTADPGYDSIAVIKADHMGTYGFKDVGVHVYINHAGRIEWGRSLERAPEYPTIARADDLVILVQGHDNSMEMPIVTTLRALLPVINAVHGNCLRFAGLPKHHARLGIDRNGTLILPAQQAPPFPA